MYHLITWLLTLRFLFDFPVDSIGRYVPGKPGNEIANSGTTNLEQNNKKNDTLHLKKCFNSISLYVRGLESVDLSKRYKMRHAKKEIIAMTVKFTRNSRICFIAITHHSITSHRPTL